MKDLQPPIWISNGLKTGCVLQGLPLVPRATIAAPHQRVKEPFFLLFLYNNVSLKSKKP
jgi:hypothetical protein